MIALEHACDFTAELSSPHEMGQAPDGVRRIIPIIGGTVLGPMINGRLLDVGADWQAVWPGNVADLDARYAIETDDRAIIEVESHGIRHTTPEIAARIVAGEVVPTSEYYMRTAIRMTTGHEAYQWVNRCLFLATGGKVGNTVMLKVYRVA